jgi:RimJ/RimL family protein N-acetyltransferase
MDKSAITAPQELRTARLLLRSVEREDISALVRLAGTREIAATTANIPHPYAEDDARNFIAHAENDFGAGRSTTYAVTIPPGNGLCGVVGLTIAPAHKRAELGYWIGVPYWGLGFATEAARAVMGFGFDALQMHRIYAHCFTGNIASQRVLEKIGMRHEGQSRRHIQKWDRLIDVENYELLACEYCGKK